MAHGLDDDDNNIVIYISAFTVPDASDPAVIAYHRINPAATGVIVNYLGMNIIIIILW